MTSETTEPMTTNRVIVVGTLDTVRDRGKQATTRTQRNELHGTIERMALQVTSPYIGTFQLPLEFEPGVKGRELLRGAKAGETVVVAEGNLQLKKTFDPRYAQDVEHRSREVHEMALHVRELRAPTDAEREATSAVWLEGIVAQPVRLLRHPELPNVQLATTILEVTMNRPSPFPGSRVVQSERVRVRVAIPTTHPHAELLYRPDNLVRAEGEVDCLLETQGGEEIRAAVATLRVEWTVKQDERAAMSEQDRQSAERRFRRDLQRITQAPRVQVVLGYIELLEGTPATLDESQDLRRAFVRQMRARRASNELMRATASGKGRGSEGQQGSDGMSVGDTAAPGEIGATAPGIDSAAGTTHAIRPRKPGKRAGIEQAIVAEPQAIAEPDANLALEQDVLMTAEAV